MAQGNAGAGRGELDGLRVGHGRLDRLDLEPLRPAGELRRLVDDDETWRDLFEAPIAEVAAAYADAAAYAAYAAARTKHLYVVADAIRAAVPWETVAAGVARVSEVLS